MKPFNGRVFRHFLTHATHKKNVLNLALLAKMENLYWLFFSYEMVFVHSLKGHGWWTTDDPVAYRYDMNDGKIFSDDTELCFPLSPKVLLYMHHKRSKVSDSPFRKFDDGTHVDATTEQFANLIRHIVDNANKYIFFNDEFKFKGPVDEFPIRFQ
jgi:hypothetical protein